MFHFIKKQLARKRKAIGVKSAGWKTQNNISFFYFITNNYFIFFYNSRDRTSNVMFAFFIYSWHFSGFTANKCNVVFSAGFCHTAYDGFHFFWNKSFIGYIIQKCYGSSAH